MAKGTSRGRRDLFLLLQNYFLTASLPAQVLALLDEEEDINQVMDYFSYEHFYVIYCKFWELDKDHDLFISKDDLAKHNDHGECAEVTRK